MTNQHGPSTRSVVCPAEAPLSDILNKTLDSLVNAVFIIDLIALHLSIRRTITPRTQQASSEEVADLYPTS
ncbi:hypothetical protein COCOBI_11-0510 [Coccomyxa sp. Obi]|nr:hypothetical protein COCOBI_11-0510 [Coccomyxa sp. Obi]